MIDGDRVRRLRQMLGQTQSAFARTVGGLTPAQVSRLERGAWQPAPEVADRIARATGTSGTLLSRPAAATVATPVHYRARAAATQTERLQSLRWTELLLEATDTMLGSLTPIPVRLASAPDEAPRRAAHLLRQQMGLTPHEPVPYVVLALERMGVRICAVPVAGRRHDAFAAWGGAAPVVGILDGVPGDRLRFSVAHELGHLVLHRDRAPGATAEDEADEFAAEFLVPRDALLLRLPRNPTLTHFRALKVEWGVSLRTLIRQARTAGLVDDARYEALFRQISARGWNRVEPGHVPVEKPRAFRKMVELLYGDDIDAFAAAMGWSRELADTTLRVHATAAELPAERVERRAVGNIAYLRVAPVAR